MGKCLFFTAINTIRQAGHYPLISSQLVTPQLKCIFNLVRTHNYKFIQKEFYSILKYICLISSSSIALLGSGFPASSVSFVGTKPLVET